MAVLMGKPLKLLFAIQLCSLITVTHVKSCGLKWQLLTIIQDIYPLITFSVFEVLMVRASFAVILITVVYMPYIGCPQVLRTDAGTENCLLAIIQPMLRHEHTDTFPRKEAIFMGSQHQTK